MLRNIIMLRNLLIINDIRLVKSSLRMILLTCSTPQSREVPLLLLLLHNNLLTRPRPAPPPLLHWLVSRTLVTLYLLVTPPSHTHTHTHTPRRRRQLASQTNDPLFIIIIIAGLALSPLSRVTNATYVRYTLIIRRNKYTSS